MIKFCIENVVWNSGELYNVATFINAYVWSKIVDYIW